MEKIKSDTIYENGFNNLKVTDIVEFKSSNVLPKILKLQNYFDKCKDSIHFKSDSLLLPISSISSILDNNFLENTEDDLVIYLDKHIKKNEKIENISVNYDEDYEYGIFDEYNLNADIIKSINEYESVKECLSSHNECSYIENYSYTVYLEISLK